MMVPCPPHPAESVAIPLLRGIRFGDPLKWKGAPQRRPLLAPHWLPAHGQFVGYGLQAQGLQGAGPLLYK